MSTYLGWQAARQMFSEPLSKYHRAGTLDDWRILGDRIRTCAKCLGRVVEKGCTAMDQTYHQRCFICSFCAKQLYGKPFYIMDGKPYCEEDYVRKLDKCGACHRPILERILKAQGKTYHPDCFRCSTCGKCLDGIPFSTDTFGNVLCMNDYKRKCAPQCHRCKQPIAPSLNRADVVRVIALGNSYHTTCYRCEDCGLSLSSDRPGRGCYPINDRLLCLSCNKRRQPTLSSVLAK